MGRVCLSAGTKCGEGKTEEPSHPTVGKQIILKTGKKNRSGNRIMLLRDMELNIKKSAKVVEVVVFGEGEMTIGCQVKISVFSKYDSSIYVTI